MAKRSITIESPAGARVNVWTDEDGGLTIVGSATAELRQDAGKCVQQLVDTFIDALTTYFPSVSVEEAQS